ncbi:transcriptional regulator [Microvirga sp. KLBC 81]|uniref:LuxR family transcriptional regulator n=1 Tax=Microvirga sp. KLBC 81 TaxID=1862707 RepID=UPI000D51D60D|nr:LuxR family transcriptional regulator [Microvirga sp. KLBC 81]PVE22855.1 transcriptional regulator [Microvirga sp. KLBC 81]
MSHHSFDHATEAFEFIGRLDDLASVQDVINEISKSFSLFGLENFIITGLPNLKERFDQVVLLRKWPIGWFEIYAKEDYVRVDPVIRLCRNTVQPFEWSEAPFDREKEPRAAEVMNRATDFRMKDGFCLPIHGINGYEACFSMSGVDLDLSPRTKPALHLMAMYAFERARQLLDPLPYRGAGLLTPREREALMWAAAGKSAADTGDILGITERTVTAHIVSACQKLDATNKTQAVARALQYKLIQI